MDCSFNKKRGFLNDYLVRIFMNQGEVLALCQNYQMLKAEKCWVFTISLDLPSFDDMMISHFDDLVLSTKVCVLIVGDSAMDGMRKWWGVDFNGKIWWIDFEGVAGGDCEDTGLGLGKGNPSRYEVTDGSIGVYEFSMDGVAHVELL